MPCFEIITTAHEDTQGGEDEILLKTTMTHNLTGIQMMNLLCK